MFAKKLGNVIVDCCNTWYVIVISLLCWRRIVLRFYVILLRFLGKRKKLVEQLPRIVYDNKI